MVTTATGRALGRAHVPPTKLFRRLAVNKTIVKARVAAAANTYTSDFPDVKFRVPALIRYRKKQSGCGTRTIIRIGLKSQFVHVPTSVDTRHFIQIHARVLSNLANRQTDRQTNAGKLVYLVLCRR